MCVTLVTVRRVNPARAGMIRTARPASGPRRRKPRASGDDPVTPQSETLCEAVNPARAGMIPPMSRARGRARCKPRASGDDPTACVSKATNWW